MSILGLSFSNIDNFLPIHSKSRLPFIVIPACFGKNPKHIPGKNPTGVKIIW
jgi:hypothetical protein